MHLSLSSPFVILAVSYVRIILNVKKYPYSAQNFGSLLSEERKLSLTLFIIAVASFLTFLPAVIWDAIIAALTKSNTVLNVFLSYF